MVSTQKIREWLKHGKEIGATNMLVVGSLLNYEDYPVYVMPEESAREKAKQYSDTLECYSINSDWDA